MNKIGNYLTDEEKYFYEKGISNLARLTKTESAELKNRLYNNSVSFFKRVGRCIAEGPNSKYSLERVIDESKLSRGEKRKLKRVFLDKQEINITNSVITLAKRIEFQELYSLMFIRK